MPSKKKARARARKTKVAITKEIHAICTHHPILAIGASCSDYDINVCLIFANKYQRFANDLFDPLPIIRSGRLDVIGLISELLNYVSLEINRIIFGNSIRVEFLRKLLLCEETDLTLKEYGQNAVCQFALPLVYMELHDRDFKDINKIEAEMQRTLADMICCPRSILRFFHRRSTCDCLKEMYYHYKDNTKREAYCFECCEVKDIRTLYRCSGCNVAQFCSYECHVSHWPEHKKDCKRWKNKSEPQE